MTGKSNQYFIRLFVVIAEFLLIYLACRLAFFLRYPAPGHGGYEDFYFSFATVFGLVWTGASLYRQAYDWAPLFGIKAYLRSLFTTLFLHLFIVFLYLVSTKGQDISRLFILYAYAASLLSLSAFRALLILSYGYLQQMGLAVRHIVMIGTGPTLDRIAGLAAQGRATVHPFLPQVPAGLSPPRVDALLSHTVEQVKVFCLRQAVHEIYVSLPLAHEAILADLAGFARDHLIALRLVADFSVLDQRRVSVDFVGNIPVLALREPPLTQPLHRATKRAFDLALSVPALLLLWPSLGPLGLLLVRLDGPGPLWERHRRAGAGGVPFWCYTLRTERVAGQPPSRLGAWLRRTGLYALPQLIHVVRGEMSWVGPPARSLDSAAAYAQSHPALARYPALRPGLTGLVQVHGGTQGATPEALQRQGAFDTRYLEGWNLFFDLKILLQAALMSLRGQPLGG